MEDGKEGWGMNRGRGGAKEVREEGSVWKQGEREERKGSRGGRKEG